MDRIKPGSYNTQKLAAEAAAMEVRTMWAIATTATWHCFEALLIV
jgi:hypothetical protein